MGKRGGGGEHTVGYWYGCGMHLVFCHGPVDAITEIRVGEKTAWSGSVTANTRLTIDQSELFGGEAREGGVQGEVDLLFGAADQGANDYLQGVLEPDLPAWRGVVSLVLRRPWLSAMNPYIKPWSLTATRIPGQGWYPETADLNGGDANPAHLLRECLTNADWGMGYPEGELDDASFRAAADTLAGESFGLSLLWDREEPIEEFVLGILRTIDGVLYVHPRTGLFVLKLARDDYTVEELPLFGPANVLTLEELSRPSWGEITNQVTVTWRDRESDQERSVTVQDVAAIQLNGGGVVAATLSHPGIGNGELANRVAMRELKQLSNALAKVVLVANRQAASLSIGDCFRLTWPDHGLTEMVCRVVRLSYGELAGGAARVEALQDLFALPQSVYATPPASGWVAPGSDPAPCPAQAILEIPYWTVVHELIGESPTLLGEVDPADGRVTVCGAAPAADAYGMTVLSRLSAGAPFEEMGNATFTPTATLTTALPQSAQTVTVGLANAVELDRAGVGGAALLEGELVQVTALDPAGLTATLARGVLDTVPVAHGAGARLWFIDGHHWILPADYVVGDQVRARLLPTTTRGTLASAAATEMSTTLNRRFIRPYCPGNVKLQGQSYPAAVAGENLALTWANRNRTTQTAYLVLQTEGNVTPESDQTTTIRWYGETGVLKRTHSGLTGTSQAWSTEVADSGLGRPNDRVTVEIESTRSGYGSWQKQGITCDRAGYGLRYGQYYGGV